VFPHVCLSPLSAVCRQRADILLQQWRIDNLRRRRPLLFETFSTLKKLTVLSSILPLYSSHHWHQVTHTATHTTHSTPPRSSCPSAQRIAAISSRLSIRSDGVYLRSSTPRTLTTLTSFTCTLCYFLCPYFPSSSSSPSPSPARLSPRPSRIRTPIRTSCASTHPGPNTLT
jgi:hypothetical protein